MSIRDVSDAGKANYGEMLKKIEIEEYLDKATIKKIQEISKNIKKDTKTEISKIFFGIIKSAIYDKDPKVREAGFGLIKLLRENPATKLEVELFVKDFKAEEQARKTKKNK